MDPTDFDALTRSWSAAGSRRRLLARLAGMALVGILAAGSAEQTAAERPLDRLLRRTQQRNRKQRNKDQGNNGEGKGKPQTKNCSDATISCYVNQQGACHRLIHTFPSVGRCGQGFRCCPCDHPDQTYWNDLCNTQFPAECNGDCTALDNTSFFPCFGCYYAP